MIDNISLDRMLSERVMTAPHSLLSREESDELTMLREKYRRDLQALRVDLARQHAAKLTAEQKTSRMRGELTRQRAHEEELRLRREECAKIADTVLTKHAEEPVSTSKLQQILSQNGVSNSPSIIADLIASETKGDREHVQDLLVKFHDYEQEIAKLRSKVGVKPGKDLGTKARTSANGAKNSTDNASEPEKRKAKLDTTSGYSPVRRDSDKHILDDTEIEDYKLEDFRVPQSDANSPACARLSVKYMEAANAHLLHNPIFTEFVEKSRPDHPADFDELALIPGVLQSENPADIIFPPAYMQKLAQLGANEFAPYLKKVSPKVSKKGATKSTVQSKSSKRSSVPSFMRSTAARQKKTAKDAGADDPQRKMPGTRYVRTPIQAPTAFKSRKWPSRAETVWALIADRVPEGDDEVATSRRCDMLSELSSTAGQSALTMNDDLPGLIHKHFRLGECVSEVEFRALADIAIRFAFVDAHDEQMESATVGAQSEQQTEQARNLIECLNGRVYLDEPATWEICLRSKGALDSPVRFSRFLAYLRDYAELFGLCFTGARRIPFTKCNKISAEDFGKICRLHWKQWLRQWEVSAPDGEADVCRVFNLEVETAEEKKDVAIFEEIAHWAIRKSRQSPKKQSEPIVEAVITTRGVPTAPDTETVITTRGVPTAPDTETVITTRGVPSAPDTAPATAPAASSSALAAPAPNTTGVNNPWVKLVKELPVVDSPTAEAERARIFKALDKNRNGTVELSELNDGFLSAFDADIPAPGQPGGELVAEVFKFAFEDACQGAPALDPDTLMNFLFYLVDFSQLYTILCAGGSVNSNFATINPKSRLSLTDFKRCLPEIKAWGLEHLLEAASEAQWSSYFEQARRMQDDKNREDVTFVAMCHWAIMEAKKDEDQLGATVATFGAEEEDGEEENAEAVLPSITANPSGAKVAAANPSGVVPSSPGTLNASSDGVDGEVELEEEEEEELE